MRKAELLLLDVKHHLVPFYISAKYHRNIPKGIPVTERTRNLFQIKQRVITPKVTKTELSILYATSRLVLFYISTKYHQNIPMGIQVTEQTRSFTPTLTGSIPKTIQKTICPTPPNPTFGRGVGGHNNSIRSVGSCSVYIPYYDASFQPLQTVL